jgi:hypothetical protein
MFVLPQGGGSTFIFCEFPEHIPRVDMFRVGEGRPPREHIPPRGVPLVRAAVPRHESLMLLICEQTCREQRNIVLPCWWNTSGCGGDEDRSRSHHISVVFGARAYRRGNVVVETRDADMRVVLFLVPPASP